MKASDTMLPMQVGIGKRQSSQSIVMEDNAITIERAARLYLFDSVILLSLGTTNSRTPFFLVWGTMFEALCRQLGELEWPLNYDRL
jgi:hypothetical protein